MVSGQFMVDGMKGTKTARGGLAPLELVLALPVLLAVVALIVNYGIVATWKVRALTVARHELWSNRGRVQVDSEDPTVRTVHPRFRTGVVPPGVGYWQTSGAGESYNLGGRLAELDLANRPVARGPLTNTVVKYQGLGGNADLLDAGRGYATGRATLDRAMPLMGKWLRFGLATDTHLVQDQWQLSTPYMSWWTDDVERGLGDNMGRRIPVIYKPDQADPQLPARYKAIVQEILNPSLQEALRPMWADLDDITFHDANLWRVPPTWQSPYLRYGPFNPTFPWCSSCWDLSRCSTDTAATREKIEGTGGLIDQIRGNAQLFPNVQSVPRKMVAAYIKMYTDVMASIDYELQWSPTDERRMVLGALRSHAEQMKDALNEFLATITY